MRPIKLPIWLRIGVIVGATVLASSFGLLAYRWYVHPVNLSVAVGSLDGELPKAMSALANRLAETNAPVRLHIVTTAGPLESAEAFSSGKTDLAVVRGDVGSLLQAHAVVVMGQAVVLLLARPGSPVTDMADLKRVTVGVVGGENNQKIVGVLTKTYELDRANVVFKNLALADTRRAFDAKEVHAVLIVAPLTEKYLSLVRGLFPNAKAPPVLISIENAGAIAEREPAFESYDVPKGALRGAPPAPSEDVTSLKVSFYLVARKSLDNDLVAGFTQALMSAQRDLVGKLPVLAQVKEPDTEAGAYLPVHPGALDYYNGNRESLLDRWSNVIFLAPIALGVLASVLAAGSRFLRSDELTRKGEALDSLYALGKRIRTAQTEANLSEIENDIDEVLTAQRARTATADENTLDAATLNVAAHRLENLIHDRRAALGIPNGQTWRKASLDHENIERPR
jgi:TRAP-type uncharacterized transport system substrate-binding protein